MTKLDNLQSERVLAMKNKNIFRKNVISNMIDSIQKAAITSKGRIEITDSLADETLIKYQKTIQEMIDTCPDSYAERKQSAIDEMCIVKEFAPQLITDEAIIKEVISTYMVGIEPIKANKGKNYENYFSPIKR